MAGHQAEDVGADINVDSFEEVIFSPEESAEVKQMLANFIYTLGSEQLAGKHLFDALFSSTPGNFRTHFSSAEAFQSWNLFESFRSMLSVMHNPSVLHEAVALLGYRHLHVPLSLQIFVPIRKSILQIFSSVPDFNDAVKQTLTKFLNYIGGALIYIRNNSVDRLKIVIDSWQQAREGTGNGINRVRNRNESKGQDDEDVGSDSDAIDASKQQQSDRQQVNFLGQGQSTVTTFRDMFEINATVMGFGQSSESWMKDILDQWDAIILNISNPSRVTEECRVLVLCLDMYSAEKLALSEFRSSLLATLRSVLPASWSTRHEEAWVWAFGLVAKLIEEDLKKPATYSSAVFDAVQRMSDLDMFQMRKLVYTRFFSLATSGQDFFKQSNTRLHFLSEKVIDLTQAIFKDPKRFVSEISGLGLRHVGFAVPIALFPPFVHAYIEAFHSYVAEPVAVEGWAWSLNLVSKILVRTLIQGSTVVMKAINLNSVEQVRDAIQIAPRKDRAQWLLHVQVGDQHISPLLWSLESGSVKVADAILSDLLMIRADRACYYYGLDELFMRHPDIVKRLSKDAPVLLSSLFSGMIWRSTRTVENGSRRRVNYYIKHILIDEKGRFNEGLKHVVATGMPTIMTHPTAVLLVDLLWNGVVLRQFTMSRLQGVLSLAVFLLSQAILPSLLTPSLSDRSAAVLWFIIFLCRLYNYIIGFSILAAFHLHKLWIWTRNTLRTIIAEIDTDGNGQLDSDELKEAFIRLAMIAKQELSKAIEALTAEDTLDGGEVSGHKVKADKDRNFLGNVTLVVMLMLILMAAQEPMFYCRGSPGWPIGICPAATKAMLYRYSVFSSIAMGGFWLCLIDLAALSTDLSAFLLVLGQVYLTVQEITFALVFLLLAWASAISLLCSVGCNSVPGGKFTDVFNVLNALTGMTVNMYQGDYTAISGAASNQLLLQAVNCFMVMACVVLVNLMIAQLNRSYEYIYADMIGFARLNRAALIVDSMESANMARWNSFIRNLRLDQNLEFDEGDLGPPGGVQVLEKASLHLQRKETIVRYGGTTSGKEPWPADTRSRDEQGSDQRLARLEQHLLKAVKRIDTRQREQSPHGRLVGGGINRLVSAGSKESGASKDSV